MTNLPIVVGLILGNREEFTNNPSEAIQVEPLSSNPKNPVSTFQPSQGIFESFCKCLSCCRWSASNK